jgi:hypothetical protein
VGWLVDLLLCRPPVPKPKTEQQLAYELVLRLLQSEKAEWPVTDRHSVYNSDGGLQDQHTRFNAKANTSVTYLVSSSGNCVTRAHVSVGGNQLKLSFAQRHKVEQAVEDRVRQVKNKQDQEQVRAQLKLLVDAAEEIL